MNDFVSKRLTEAGTMLGRWRTSPARVWEYRAPHGALTLRLEESGREGNLQLSCLGPVFVAGPAAWDRNELQVATIGKAEHGPRFLVWDEAASFMCLCEMVEVAENRK